MTKINPESLFKLLSQPISKRIDQKAIEEWAAGFWSLPQLRPPPTAQRAERPFVMMFPPPNITGNLHLGHALTGAIQDALIRHRRMTGSDCIFIPGFDHAGLATQNIVENQLLKNQGITRQQLGRDKFIKLVDQWKDEKRREMREQLNRLGLDLTGSKEYFTMDENSSLAVQSAFKQLFTSGIIYRSTKPIFWSEKLQTTLSDIEVDSVDGIHRYSRTGEIVLKRPLSQWFIDARALAEKAVQVVEDDSIAMIPKSYTRSWSSWLIENGVQDWCISRQSWWGHRIPAYKAAAKEDVKENWIVADSLEEAKLTLGQFEDVIQDSDVLDTWFSSSLIPLSISGWPNTEKFLRSCEKQHFPLHVMETGFDILTFWVSKMTMMSLALTNRIPFKLVLLHGMICDSHGKKMSKSRGNVIDLLDVIDGASLQTLQQRTKDAHAQGILDEDSLGPVLENQKRLFPNGIPACGADGLRTYLLSHDFQEEVVRIQVQQIDKIRRLSNKIWNIYRFALMLMDEDGANSYQIPLNMDITKIDRSRLDEDDQQVLSQMSNCVATTNDAFSKTYHLYRCLYDIESFIRVDLSKNYLEKSKNVLTGREGRPEERAQKMDVFTTCLLTSTKLLHPFMPHLSEFLYQKLTMQNAKCESSVHSDSPLATVLLSYGRFPSCGDWSSFSKEAPSMSE